PPRPVACSATDDSWRWRPRPERAARGSRPARCRAGAAIASRIPTAASSICAKMMAGSGRRACARSPDRPSATRSRTSPGGSGSCARSTAWKRAWRPGWTPGSTSSAAASCSATSRPGAARSRSRPGSRWCPTPRAHQEFVFALAAAPDREDAVARLARLHDPQAIRASRAAAEANTRERARRHGLTAGEAMELERIGAALAYGDPRLAALPGREPGAPSVPPADTGLALPPGIPLVLVEDADRAGLWKQAEAAWAYWRDLGFTTALIGIARSGLRSMLE